MGICRTAAMEIDVRGNQPAKWDCLWRSVHRPGSLRVIEKTVYLFAEPFWRALVCSAGVRGRTAWQPSEVINHALIKGSESMRVYVAIFVELPDQVFQILHIDDFARATREFGLDVEQ